MVFNVIFLRPKNLKYFLFGFISLCISTYAASGEERTKNPFPDTSEWRTYIAKSERWKALDTAIIARELKAFGLDKAKLPEHTNKFGFETKNSDEWFKSDEGERIMSIVLSFQTPSGGWSKRTNMAKNPREKGQAFGVEADYIPTFDNDATSTQLRLLAQAHTVTHKRAYADAFERGVKLILDAQYPTGGWPQNYPLVGGYHDQITYNDNLMTDLLELLYDISLAKNEFAFTSKKIREQARLSFVKGLECVKKTQVLVNGQLTIWGAQHDRITLAPTNARNFEMTSLASAESAWLINFLMDVDTPDAEIIKSVHAAAKWLNENKITGQRWSQNDVAPRADVKALPMWARFYEIGTNKPLFGDRDSSIHYAVNEISEERRKGYAWYNTVGNKVLEKYKAWAEKYPLKP
jgi:PelA/Pel-15E family pectate lyase